MNAFDTIAGCSLGTKSWREVCAEIIDYVGSHSENNPAVRDQWVTLANCPDNECLDLSTELGNWAADELAELIPPYCYIDWQDNELRVLPSVESAREDTDVWVCGELPDEDDCRQSGDLALVINDHGNATLYQWEDVESVHDEWAKDRGHWRYVWAVV